MISSYSTCTNTHRDGKQGVPELWSCKRARRGRQCRGQRRGQHRGERRRRPRPHLPAAHGTITSRGPRTACTPGTRSAPPPPPPPFPARKQTHQHKGTAGAAQHVGEGALEEGAHALLGRHLAPAVQGAGVLALAARLRTGRRAGRGGRFSFVCLGGTAACSRRRPARLPRHPASAARPQRPVSTPPPPHHHPPPCRAAAHDAHPPPRTCIISRRRTVSKG